MRSLPPASAALVEHVRSEFRREAGRLGRLDVERIEYAMERGERRLRKLLMSGSLTGLSQVRLSRDDTTSEGATAAAAADAPRRRRGYRRY